MSGGKYKEGGGYKYNFIEPALKKILELRDANPDETIAWIIADEGWTDDDWDNFNSAIEGLNVSIVKISDKDEFIDYINNKTGGDSRANDRITKFVVFSHGWEGTISLGYDYTNSYNTNLNISSNDIGDINGDAFNNPNSWFGSCNTATGGTNSFAYIWRNTVGGTTWAFKGQSTYGYIMYPKGYVGWLPWWWIKRSAILNAREQYGFSAKGSDRYPQAATGARQVIFR